MNSIYLIDLLDLKADFTYLGWLDSHYRLAGRSRQNHKHKMMKSGFVDTNLIPFSFPLLNIYDCQSINICTALLHFFWHHPAFILFESVYYVNIFCCCVWQFPPFQKECIECSLFSLFTFHFAHSKIFFRDSIILIRFIPFRMFVEMTKWKFPFIANQLSAK